MQPSPEIRAQLVHILFSAMPQVVASTLATVLLALMVWWHIPSAVALGCVIASVLVVLVRLGTLIGYRRRHGHTPAPPAEAIQWERLYGAFSIAMGVIVATCVLTSFLFGNVGTQLITTGVTVGICGGQSAARLTCRAWIPITSGTIMLAALTVGAIIWHDPLSAIFATFVVMYYYTYLEACQHSANTMAARLTAEAELAGLARRDALTGLGNRMGFEEELERAYLALHRGRAQMSLLVLDLDGFKTVNDDFGHPTGDLVLRGVADRLRALSRRTDYVARIGGDEFAIVVTGAHDQASLIGYARRLIAAIARPFEVAGQEAHIGVSVGATSTGGAAAPAELLAAADVALYQVKKRRKNDVAFAPAPQPPRRPRGAADARPARAAA